MVDYLQVPSDLLGNSVDVVFPAVGALGTRKQLYDIVPSMRE